MSANRYRMLLRSMSSTANRRHWWRMHGTSLELSLRHQQHQRCFSEAARTTIATTYHAADSIKSPLPSPSSAVSNSVLPSNAAPSSSVPGFTPRTEFQVSSSLVNSYFLGHHKAGLTKMKQLIGSVDLIVECRDYRVPLSSRNPLFEDTLQGKERLVVYTKRDLAEEKGSSGELNDEVS